MAGYCTSVRPYFHEPQAVKIQHKSAKKKKNPAILPSYNYQNIEYDFSRQVLHMRSSKVIAACIFNKLQAVGLFLVLTVPAHIPFPSPVEKVL